MKDIINSLSTSLERLYQGFVLRDLLGFILPGSIFLLSIWCLATSSGNSTPCNTDPLNCISHMLGKNWNTIQIIAFLGGSYLTALILQSFHYGLVDMLFQLSQIPTKIPSHRLRRLPNWLFWLLWLLKWLIWPISGTIIYIKGIRELQDNDNNKRGVNLNNIPSLMSIGALAPDKGLQNLESDKALSRLQESKAYAERISVLQMVLGNTVLAGIPFLALIYKSKSVGGWWTLLGAIVLSFGYLEHWRLFYIRNLRHEILIEAANAIKEIAQDKDEQPKETTDASH